MKYMNYLRLSFLIIILFNGQVFGGPLYDALKPIFDINLMPITIIQNYEKVIVTEDFILPVGNHDIILEEDELGPYLLVPHLKLQENRSISGADLQKKLRETAAFFLKEEHASFNSAKEFIKKNLLNELVRAHNIMLDLRNVLNPIENELPSTNTQLQVWKQYNDATEILYKNFLTLSSHILAKKTSDNISDDIQFFDAYTSLKTNLLSILEASIKSLELNDASGDLIPFYVYNLTNNPKPFPNLTNTASQLEKLLKDTFQLIDEVEFLQENLRNEANAFFLEQKRIVGQLKNQFSNMMQYYMQKEGFHEKIDYRRQDVTYESSNAQEAIQNKSLKDIFEELHMDKNYFMAMLLDFSKNLKFAGNNIFPFSPDDFANPLFNINQDAKKLQFHQNIVGFAAKCAADIDNLLIVLSEGDRFAEVNPAHLTFYRVLLENLEGLFGSYAKYLGITMDDNSQQNPPLFVQTFNLKQ